MIMTSSHRPTAHSSHDHPCFPLLYHSPLVLLLPLFNREMQGKKLSKCVHTGWFVLFYFCMCVLFHSEHTHTHTHIVFKIKKGRESSEWWNILKLDILEDEAGGLWVWWWPVNDTLSQKVNKHQWRENEEKEGEWSRKKGTTIKAS